MAQGGPDVRAKLGDVAAWLDDHLPISAYGGRAVVERWLDMHAHPETVVQAPSFDDMAPARGMAV
jgi:hypothetical protein